MKQAFTFALLYLILGNCIAQSGPDAVISDLVESGLLDRYRQYRKQTETHVASLKTTKPALTHEELEQMRKVYMETSSAFEDFVLLIHSDFLDPRTRKYILKHSQAYLNTRMEELDLLYEEYYMGKFFPAYQDATQSNAVYRMRLDGPSLPEPMTQDHPAVNATHQLLNYLESQKAQEVELFSQRMEKILVKPNLFKKWEEFSER